MNIADTDRFYMQAALDLAIKAYGHVSPNPYVGAVLVKDQRIIGQGWHQKAGSPHAEVNAIKDAYAQGYDPLGATIYVTLEPCCHFGKTPPCSDLLIESGIGRVVVAMQDPNPLVAGQGLAQLKAAGIAVELGILETQAKELNRIFIHNQQAARPFVALKSAISLDGKCATQGYDSKWISNESSRQYTHFLRQGFDAILIGHGTLAADNPQLTIRHPDFSGDGKKLTRIILSAQPQNLDLNAQIFNDGLAPTLLVIPEGMVDSCFLSKFQELKVEVLACPVLAGKIDLAALLTLLQARNIHSVFVEGGPKIYSAFWQAQLVDWLYLFQAPIIIGSRQAPGLWDDGDIMDMKNKIQFSRFNITQLGDNQLLEGQPIFMKA